MPVLGNPAVNTVSLKLPTFWTSNPNFWLKQAEAQFAVRNTYTDATKFHYAVSSLDSAMARRSAAAQAVSKPR